MHRLVNIFSFIILCGNPLLAQNVTFTASAPNIMRVGEQFQVTYSLNVKPDELNPPDFSDFQFLGGPSTGSSTSIQVINGKTTRTSSYTFTYYLRATKAGKFNLEAATVKYKKDEFKSNSLSFEVIGNSQTQTGQGSGSGQGSAQTTQANTDGENIFIRLILDKKSAYVGEQITATIKLYTKVNISNYNTRFAGPDLRGFYKQDIEMPRQISLQREKVGNDIYSTGILRKMIIYPQRSGEIIIPEFELEAVVPKQVRRPTSIFDEFFGGGYQNVSVMLKSKPVKLNVKPLPGNQPLNFDGAVGSFKIGADVSETSVSTNDAITFKVTISGKGNIKLLEGLDYELPPTFDQFDPTVKSLINTSTEGRTGKKIFEITAIPRHAGDFEVGPFRFSYFDPKTKSYETIRSQRFNISVERSLDDTSSVMISNLSKEAVQLLGSDIKYIDTNTELKKYGFYLFGKYWFNFIYVFLVLFLIVIIIIQRKQIKRNADQVRLKNRKANKVARKRMKVAKHLAKINDENKFYEEITRAVWGYLSDKMNIPVSELSEEKIRETLKDKSIDTEISDQLFDLIKRCEFARYAPSTEKPVMHDVIKSAETVISILEQKL